MRIRLILFILMAQLTSPASAQQIVSITTSDNVDLKASYFPADTPGPSVLFVHMCRADADRSTWNGVANRLAAAGLHSLAVDLRGYGESSGGEPAFTTMANFIDFWRSTGFRDIEAARTFIRSRPGMQDQKLALVGASCGVFIGVEAAKQFEELTTLVLLSGPFDNAAAETLNTLDHVPVLGAASEQDGRAYEAMKRVFSATNHPASRNLQFKGDAHGTDMFLVQPELEQTIVNWLARWLAP